METKHSSSRNVIPSFEERVMQFIGKFKLSVGNTNLQLSDLTTTDKSSLIAAINEIKSSIGSSVVITFGEKKTGVDAGTLKALSFTDDRGYVCVVEGDVGVAVWKTFLLSQT